MFDLELDRVIGEVQSRGSQQVLVQLPDGLKTHAREIVDRIERETQAQAFIWLSSCFGACDLPMGLDALNIDLMVQWGHNRYHKTPEMW